MLVHTIHISNFGKERYLLRRIKRGKSIRGTGGIVKEICFYKEIKKEAQRYYLKNGQSDHKNGKSDEKEKRGQKNGP